MGLRFLKTSATAPTSADNTSQIPPSSDKPPPNRRVTRSEPVWDNCQAAKLSPPNSASRVTSDAVRNANGQAVQAFANQGLAVRVSIAAITREASVGGAVNGGRPFNCRSIS